MTAGPVEVKGGEVDRGLAPGKGSRRLEERVQRRSRQKCSK